MLKTFFLTLSAIILLASAELEKVSQENYCADVCRKGIDRIAKKCDKGQGRLEPSCLCSDGNKADFIYCDDCAMATDLLDNSRQYFLNLVAGFKETCPDQSFDRVKCLDVCAKANIASGCDTVDPKSCKCNAANRKGLEDCIKAQANCDEGKIESNVNALSEQINRWNRQCSNFVIGPSTKKD